MEKEDEKRRLYARQVWLEVDSCSVLIKSLKLLRGNTNDIFKFKNKQKPKYDAYDRDIAVATFYFEGQCNCRECSLLCCDKGLISGTLIN